MRKDWLPDIIAITILAIAVRALTACWTGLIADEANGVLLAVSGSWVDLLHHLKEDGNPPLLSILIRLHASVFGASDISVKLLALLIGTLQVPLSYLICRTLLSRELSLQVAIMLALCPPLVRYSTLIRAYGLMSILSLVSTWACMHVLASKRGMFWPAFYGISTAGLVFSHYWGAFIAIGQAGLVAIGLLKGWVTSASARRWLSGVAVSVALFLPWLPTLHYQLHHVVSPWDSVVLPSTVIMQLASSVLVGANWGLDPFSQFCILFSSFLILATIFSPQILQTPKFDGRLWKTATMCGYLAGLLVTLIVPVVRDRYLTPFAPLLCILYVTTFHALTPALPAIVRNVLPVALWLPLWIPQLISLVQQPETSTPAIAYEIENRADRQRDLVVISWPPIAPAITFYLPHDIEVVSPRDDLRRVEFNRWADMLERVRDPKILPALFAKMSTTLNQGGKIWLVDKFRQVQSADYTDNSLVQNLPYLAAEDLRMDQIRTWLAIHAEPVGTNKLAPGRDGIYFLAVYRPRPPKPSVEP